MARKKKTPKKAASMAAKTKKNAKRNSTQKSKRPNAKRAASTARRASPTKKTAQKSKRKAALKPARTSALLDESLLSLLESPTATTRKGAAILKAQREKWFDVMTSRFSLKKMAGKLRGKTHRISEPTSPEEFRRPEPRQFYTEARAFADGNALVQFLAYRPFIARMLGYEGFTVGKSQKKKTPTREEMKTIRELEFISELPPKERAQALKQILVAYKAANSGGIIFQVEVDYDRPGRTPIERLDEDEEDVWETAKKRDAKGGATKARKARRKSK